MRRKIKIWIRNKLIALLGIAKIQEDVKELYRLNSNLVSIGVDVHFKEPTTIIIVSKVKGGQVRHIPTGIATMEELNRATRMLRKEYNTNDERWDRPPQYIGKY
jgi:hypothetical protein